MSMAIPKDKIMPQKRTQLTLFINSHDSSAIEKIRKEYNPLQYALIKSHVTLCRENELEQLEKIIHTLNNLEHPGISIDFGPAVRFSAGKGVMIPAAGDNNQFQQLRKIILQDVKENQDPHITLLHPRNAVCTDSIFEQIEKIKLPRNLTFSTISLIEQEEDNKWNVLREFELRKGKA